MNRFKHLLLVIAAALTPTLLSVPAAAQNAPAIGIVVMHGKGGSPTARHMTPFVTGLESKGLLVANLEMPWSGRRDYNADVATAETEVTAALNELRRKGAKKVFVSGHSQGGVFASHYASKYPVDGAILIAPGGNVSNSTFRQQVGGAVEQARQGVAAADDQDAFLGICFRVGGGGRCYHGGLYAQHQAADRQHRAGGFAFRGRQIGRAHV